jgi:glycosyltransferase involved in cell wall biosynthesis
VRVLHVYSGNLFGGIESILVSVAQFAPASGVAHEFALCFDARLAAELRDIGAPIHALAPVRVSRPQTIRAARRRLAALLAARMFDACVLHAPWAYALFAPVVRRADPPCVLWAHDAWSGRHWTEAWARRTAPDLVIANSAFTARTLDGIFAGVPRLVVHAPLDVTPTIISVAERAAIRAELATPASAVVIVQASRMEAWKGHATLLRALAALRDEPRWTCWIVGGAQRPAERTYEASLHALASELGVADRVRFAGERTDVRRVLAAADVYAQPNTRPEPFGIVLVEALLAGVPVVTTSVGGAMEIVNETCGWLVAPDAIDGWVPALSRAIDDAAARARLGGAGPARAAALCEPTCQMARVHEALRAARHAPVAG